MKLIPLQSIQLLIWNKKATSMVTTDWEWSEINNSSRNGQKEGKALFNFLIGNQRCLGLQHEKNTTWVTYS